jgi:hypothetical protein
MRNPSFLLIARHFCGRAAVMSLAVFVGASCSQGGEQGTDSLARAERTAAQPTPGRYSLQQFQRLRWLEGDWRGRLPDGGSFYERYRLLDDSTIAMRGFADSTFTKVTDSARIALRGGTIIDEGGSAPWVATRLESNAVDFASTRDASNGFTWTRESPDRWTATLRSTDRQRRPQTTIYPMERIRR